MTYITDTIELRKAMVESGYKTIGQLSDDCGVNRNTLGKIISGEKQPTAEAMYKIADCLSFSPERAGSIFFTRDLRNT